MTAEGSPSGRSQSAQYYCYKCGAPVSITELRLRTVKCTKCQASILLKCRAGNTRTVKAR